MNEQTPRLPSQLSARMSAHDFAMWGLQDVAYIRPIHVEGSVAWAICAADGTGIAVAQERDLAFAAALQNDLEPVSVH
jgi:hypothetical protein